MHSLELWRNFVCGNETGSPGRAVSLHLARSGRQSEHRIRRILPARGACHIIRNLLCLWLTMLFSVNCETRKVIIVIRDLPPLIDVNCWHDPPLRPLITPRKITSLKHKSRRKQRIRCRKKCRYFENICFSFRGKTQIKSKRGVVTNYKRRNDLQPATNTWKIQQPPQKQAGLQCNSHSWRHISPFRICHINSPPGS